MRFAPDVEDDRPVNDAAADSEAFAVLALLYGTWQLFVYLRFVIRASRGTNLVVVFVCDGDALKGGFEIGDLHCAEMLHGLTKGRSWKARSSNGKLLVRPVNVLRLTR
jgi:hypothetical protein